jgi:hypothetical protein
VQQDLANPGVLERFVSQAEATELRTFFAGLWGLDDLEEPATAAVVAAAIQNPEAYVLKPQREGGGNNFYGKICYFLAPCRIHISWMIQILYSRHHYWYEMWRPPLTTPRRTFFETTETGRR